MLICPPTHFLTWKLSGNLQLDNSCTGSKKQLCNCVSVDPSHQLFREMQLATRQNIPNSSIICIVLFFWTEQCDQESGANESSILEVGVENASFKDKVKCMCFLFGSRCMHLLFRFHPTLFSGQVAAKRNLSLKYQIQIANFHCNLLTPLSIFGTLPQFPQGYGNTFHDGRWVHSIVSWFSIPNMHNPVHP